MKRLYKEGKYLSKEIEEMDMPHETVAIWNIGQSGVIIKGKANDGDLSLILI